MHYNSHLNLNYMDRTKSKAFADDFIHITRGKTVREAEKVANVEVSKVSARAKQNKISFNDQKSKVMLMTRRKRKERKDLQVYLNNKPLMQVHSLKYLGIILDCKLTFRDHINFITEKCTKLIFALSNPQNSTGG